MTSQFFLGFPLVTQVGGRPSTGSPVLQSTLPTSARQRIRYNADKSIVLLEIVCDEMDVAAVSAQVLSNPNNEACSTQEAYEKINSGQFK